MGYIVNSLSKGEEVVYQAKVHWGVYIPSIFFGVLALVTFGASLIIAIPLAVGAWLYSVNTEMAVTNKKVVGKWGLIQRITIEQRLTKVDSIVVNQGLFGRMFGYGSVNVRGSGSSDTPIKYIGNPIEFKRQVEHAIEAAEATA